MDAADPRIEWLVSQAPRWRAAKEKTLVFVAHRETLEMLRTTLSQRAQLATGMFHEALHAGTPRHGSRALPRGRRPQPAGLDRMRRRRPQLRVLPAARAVRSAVEAVGGGTAHRPARSHRPPHPGGGRRTFARPPALAAMSCGCSRRWGCSANRSRDSSRNWRRLKARSSRSRSIPTRHSPTNASTRSSTKRTPRAPAFAKPRISNSTAIPIDRRWRRHPGANPDRSWTRSIRKWWSRRRSALDSPSRIRRATACSRSSSAAARWSMACRACRPARAMSARSIVRKRSRTSSSTSSRPGIRWSKASLRTTKTAPSGRAVRFEITIGTEAERGPRRHLQGRARVRGGRDRRGRQRPAGLGGGRPPPADRRPPGHRRGRQGSRLARMVRRLGAQLDPTRRLHAIAAIEVRP